MKNTIQGFIIVTLLFFTAAGSMAQALDAETVTDLQKTPKFAFGVSDEFHFKSVLGMYDRFVESGIEIAAFEIIVKGPLVSDLVKGSELETFFEKYRSKVRVSVCSFAMEKRKVTKEQLFPGLDVVATASIRMLQLQALGYNTLTY
ncbi:DsrE family protein [Robertkochia solimangrovi]|uniref:DsrE family protein n=1 Tax=Robertkochia solimangrovi TaxID=2213046 RepID=UPI00117D140A|nr:DsrE family protein [Robertkochia solimangrovi]TRZ41610.1 hypothetical protein DMZ48_16505 [Robertkochia solimangrovi]